MDMQPNPPPPLLSSPSPLPLVCHCLESISQQQTNLFVLFFFPQSYLKLFRLNFPHVSSFVMKIWFNFGRVLSDFCVSSVVMSAPAYGPQRPTQTKLDKLLGIGVIIQMLRVLISACTPSSLPSESRNGSALFKYMCGSQEIFTNWRGDEVWLLQRGRSSGQKTCYLIVSSWVLILVSW